MIGARNLKKNGNSFVGGWSGWLSHFFLCLLSLLNSYSQMFSSRQAEKWLFSRSSRCFCTCDQKLKKVDAKINLAKTQKCLFLKSFHSCFTNSLEWWKWVSLPHYYIANHIETPRGLEYWCKGPFWQQPGPMACIIWMHFGQGTPCHPLAIDNFQSISNCWTGSALLFWPNKLEKCLSLCLPAYRRLESQRRSTWEGFVGLCWEVATELAGPRCRTWQYIHFQLHVIVGDYHSYKG